jgi:hypothetical protein
VEARAQQPGVQAQFGLRRELRYDCRPLRIPLDGLPEVADQGGVRLPLDVFGWVERRDAPYGRFPLSLDRNPPSLEGARALANSRAVL